MSTTVQQDRIYYVDSGIGKKIAGCPYTHYKDGRDIRSFIVPPKGYELTGFKFEPYPETNAFYDGRIIAQYEQVSFAALFKKNPWKYLAFFSIIGGVIVGAIFFTINWLKPDPEPFMDPKTEIATLLTDTTKQGQATNTISIAENNINEESAEDATALEEIAKEKEAEKVQPVEKAAEEVRPIENTVEHNEKETETVQQAIAEPKPAREPQTVETLTKERFHQEFWDLIHQKESHMRTYHDFYSKYKGLNLKSQEFYYLYLTILENTKAFETWKNKLVRIPDNELKSIHTINALKEKLEEFD